MVRGMVEGLATRLAKSGGAPMWPAYDAASDQYMQLLDSPPVANAHLSQAQCDFWDSFTPPAAM